MDETAGPLEPDALTLLPEVEARRRLASRPLAFRLLVPPGETLGVGTLRTLRLVERDNLMELVAGYERYERPARPPHHGGRL